MNKPKYAMEEEGGALPSEQGTTSKVLRAFT